MERVYVACDVSNLWHSCRLQFGKTARVDFQLLSELIPSLAKPQQVRQNLVAYLVSDAANTRQGMFANTLLSYGFSLRTRDLSHHKFGSGRTNWDIGITIDAIHHLQDYDTFILMNGDGDFTDLLDHLKLFKKKVVVMSFAKNMSDRLQETAHSVIPLTEEITYRIDDLTGD